MAGQTQPADAAIFSLIETAKANGFEPYHYLRHVFERLPLITRTEDYKNLLPPISRPGSHETGGRIKPSTPVGSSYAESIDDS